MKQFFLLLIVSTIVSFNSLAFNHPCLLHNQEDFDYVKAHIAEEPYASALVKLKNSQYAKTTYTPSPVEYLARLDANNWSSLNDRWQNAGIADLWYQGIHNNYTNFMKDAAAAYQLALLYKIEDNTKAADAAKNIIVSWSKKNKGILRNKNGDIIDPNEKLIMFQPYQMAVAIEMLRDYNNWGSSSEFAAVLKWIDESFYPLCHEHLELQNNSTTLHYWMNWDLASLATVLALGILTDNQAYVDEAINYYKGKGGGPGNIKVGVPFLHSDPDSNEILGQGNELGRDQGHNTLCAAVLGTFCQMGLKIGEDLFAYDNYRAIALAEYVAKYNLANENLYPNPMQNFPSMNVGSSDSDFEYPHSSFPFTTYTYGDQGTHRAPSQDSRGTVRPGWDYFTGYCNSNGISSIYSNKMAERIRPDGGGGQYSSNSGGFDQIGFSTLMGYRPLQNSDDGKNPGDNDNDFDFEAGNLVLSPTADTQIRKGNTTDYGGEPNMEIYYTMDQAKINRDKEFYGLMKFELPAKLLDENCVVNGATLRLVCVQNKGDRNMGLYKYDKAFSEHTTFEIEEQAVRNALSQAPFVTFSAAGKGPWSMNDKGKDFEDKYKNAEGWTSYLDISEFVNQALSNGETTISFLISKINPTSEAMRFATQEATTINNEDGFSFPAESLVPQLIINYVGKADDSTVDDPKDPEVNPDDPKDPEVTPDDPKDPEVTPDDPKDPEVTPDDPKDPEVNPDDPKDPEVTPDDPKDPEVTPDDPKDPEVTPDDPKDPEVNPDDPKDPEVTPDDPKDPEVTPDDPKDPEVTPDDPKDPEVTPDDSNDPDNGEQNPDNPDEDNEPGIDGVSTINSDDNEIYYFDLNGIRVNHPSPGELYIEIKDGVRRKIIFQN